MHYQLQIQNTSILFSYTYKPKKRKYIENEIKTVKIWHFTMSLWTALIKLTFTWLSCLLNRYSVSFLKLRSPRFSWYLCQTKQSRPIYPLLDFLFFFFKIRIRPKLSYPLKFPLVNAFSIWKPALGYPLLSFLANAAWKVNSSLLRQENQYLRL
jgi:hypothetical protein